MGERGGRLEGNGDKLGGMGGNGDQIGEISGIAHGMWVVEGCSGMWLRKLGEKCKKMRGKWEENGTKSPVFAVPFFQFS